MGRSRRVFVDTSAWYAVAVGDDKYHERAARYFEDLLRVGACLLTSDYVLDETLTRLRYDLGHAPAIAFWERLEQARQQALLTILPVDQAIWTAALDIFRKYDDQEFSFTDCTSFVLAQREPVAEVFAFDSHFLMFCPTLSPGV